MNSNPITRALVLAGAGAAGNAWQIGLIAGLAEAGVDLTEAELIVGTSAGSTVAAQITGSKRPAELYAAILDEPPRSAGVVLPIDRGRGHLSGPNYMAWSDEIIETSADAADMRRRFGAAALAADTGQGSSRWRDMVASRLPGRDWPQRCILITAVDASTGEPVVFDRDSGVDLVDAVAASTSNGFGGAYAIGARRYLNGGYRRSSNADLAAGCGRIVILEPFSGASRQPHEWGMDLGTQVAELRASGSRVETVFPSAAAGDVFNANALDPATRPPAARGGYEQGLELAGDLSSFWLSSS